MDGTQAGRVIRHPRLSEAPSGPRQLPGASIGRIDGIDVARAVAFGAMLLAHFAYSRPGDPVALAEIDNAANSLSGPLFCVVLGVGAALLSDRGAPSRLFVKRGLALLVVGIACWPFADHALLILPHLGLLLAAAGFLRRVGDRWLLPLALLAFLAPSAVTAVLDDHNLHLARQPWRYAELFNVPHVVGNVLWSGGYPLVGWIGFLLVGLWLGHRSLDDVRTLRRLAVGGIAVSISQPVFDRAFRALDGRAHDPDAGGLAAFLDTSAHSNRTAWYLLASSTVVAVTAVCLLVTRHRHAALRPLVSLGQMALSAYLTHILLLNYLIWDWRIRSDPSLALQFLLAAATFLAFAIIATAYRGLSRRGPLEAVLRTISG